MFQITAETCRAFTFAEVLIMAAINVESIRLRSESSCRPNNAAGQTKNVRHVVPTRVHQSPQL